MKKILLIIDPQYDFCEGGSLAVETANAKMAALGEYLTNLKNEEYSTVIVTCDWHPFNHSSFVEKGGQWPTHCVQHSHGAAIHNAVLEGVQNYCKTNKTTYTVLTKGNVPTQEEYSVFQNFFEGPKLLHIIEMLKIEEIDILGIAGDFCVLEHIKGLIANGMKDKIRVLLPFTASIDGGTKLQNFIEENELKTME